MQTRWSTPADAGWCLASSICTPTGGGGFQVDAGAEAIAGGLRDPPRTSTTRTVLSLVANWLDEPGREPRAHRRHRRGRPARARLPPRGAVPRPDAARCPPPRAPHRPAARRGRAAPSARTRAPCARSRSRPSCRMPSRPSMCSSKRGDLVGVGHTEATYEQASKRSTACATAHRLPSTRCRASDHRAPGPVVAALEDERVTLELILDGTHASGRRCAGLRRRPTAIALVMDPWPPPVVGDGDYQLGELAVSVNHGLAVLRQAPTRSPDRP